MSGDAVICLDSVIETTARYRDQAMVKEMGEERDVDNDKERKDEEKA
jgi:hypothetical protein